MAQYDRHHERLGEALAYVATSSYFNEMKAVGIKVLKNKLSEYVRLAGDGEDLTIPLEAIEKARLVANDTRGARRPSPL